MVDVRKVNIPPSVVKEIWNYDPETGILTWACRASSQVDKGAVAGAVNKNTGYRTVMYKRVPYLAHRLVWAYVHGVWPSGEIDHKNLSKDDNRITNLRDAPTRLNRGNVRPYRGVLKGTHADRGYWRAKIAGRHIGMFATEEEAHEAYKKEAAVYFGEFARFE